MMKNSITAPLAALAALGLVALSSSYSIASARTEPLVKTVVTGKTAEPDKDGRYAVANPSPGQSGWTPGISYSVSEDGGVRYAHIDQTFRTVLGKPGKRFVKWFQLEDRFGVKGFYGSLALKARGSRGVTGILVKARGGAEEDGVKKIHKIREGKPGDEVLDFTSKEGLRYRVRVNPESAGGKTFDIRIEGKVKL